MGMGNFGAEDISFSLGLNGLTLVDSLATTEQKVGDTLSRIGKHFANLKAQVEAAGSNNRFKDNLTETSKVANKLAAQLRVLLAELRAVNAELTKTKASGSATAGLNQQLATVAKLQAAVAKLQQQTINTGAKIGQASASATKNLSQVATQATTAANRLQQVGSNAQNTATQLNNMGNAGQNAAAKVALTGKTLNQQFQQTGGYLRNISTVLSAIGLGGGIFSLIYGFKQLVKEGIEFNSQVEQAKISLAAEVVSNAKLVEVDGKRVEGLQAIRAVQGQVSGLVAQLKTDALFVNGTFEDLLGIAQSIAPQVFRIGGNLTQVHRITQLAGIAASVLNVSFKEAATGLSQLLNGQALGRNVFVRRLPIPIDELRAGIKDTTTRAEYLIGVLQRLEDAGPLVLTSFKGATQSIRDLLQQVSGQAFSPLTDRLRNLANAFIGSNLTREADGTVKWSDQLEGTVSRISRLVDTLLAQISLLVQKLSNTGGKNILDLAEENLPKIIDGLGNLLQILAHIGGFLSEHAGMVLKLVGYYLTFNVAVGLFNTLWGVVTKVSTAITALQSGVLRLAGGFTDFRGTVTALTGSLQVLATKTIVGLLVVAVMELVSGFMDAAQSAKDFKIAADDINNLSFDTAIGQIRKMVNELREGENMWTRFWYTITHGGPKLRLYSENIDSLTGSAVSKSLGILDSLGVTSGLARNTFGGLDNIGELANMGQYVGKGLETIRQREAALQEEAKTASDKRREDIKKELGAYATQQEALRQTLALLKENVLAQQALERVAKEGSTQSERDAAKRYLANSRISLFAAAGETVPAVEAGLNLPSRVKVTPNNITPENDNAAKRLLQNESALLAALEQVSQASARVLDRNYQRQQQELDLLVQKHVLTVQQAADQEIKIAQDTADKKLSVQRAFFDKLSQNGLVDLAGAKEALGLAGGGKLSFDELKGLPDGVIAQAIADIQAKEGTAKPLDQAKFQKQVRDLEALSKVWASVNQEEEKLSGTIAENTRRKVKAEEDSTNAIKEQNALMVDRQAQLDLEEGKLFDISGSLEDRIKRERTLTDLIVARSRADIDRKAQKKINDINEKTNWTPEQKAEAIRTINSDAERQKRFQAAKEEIDLMSRIVGLRDQEILLGSTGTQIREIELGTLRQILGAENPLVIAKQNELALEKAKTLEAQAQARFQAAAELSAKGQRTAAREATNQGNVLMAQAKALRDEQTTYLETLGKGLEKLSGLIGRFSGVFGSLTSGLGQLLGGISNLSKLSFSDSMAWVNGAWQKVPGAYNQAKGGSTGVMGALKGVLGVADPIAGIATTALGMFQEFFNIFQAGWKRLLEDAHDKIQKQLDATMNDLRTGKSTLSATIADLQNQLAHVEDKYPKAKSTPWWSWIFPVVKAGLSLYNGMSNAARQDAIDQDIKTYSDQILQLARDAQDAIYKLQHETLPALRVTPGMRDFQSEIEAIRKELNELAGTPGITQSDLNEMFTLQIADLEKEALDKILDQKQEYLDILKQEKDLQDQIADLDKEKAQVEQDYKNQRAQILGLVTRELSKAEQLAQLKQDEQDKVDDIAKRRKDLEDQLAYVEKQKSAYEEVYGVVQDIGEYQTAIQDQLVEKTKEQLGFLQQFYQQIKDIIASGMWPFVTSNGATLANGQNPYAIPMLLTNPQPITPPEPPQPTNDVSGDQYNLYMSGDININGNLTQAEVRQSFLEGFRAFNQQNAVRGLAHSNA